jgi:hypothetical protein
MGKNGSEMAEQISLVKKEIRGEADACGTEMTKLQKLLEENDAEMKPLITALGKASGTSAEQYILAQIDDLHQKRESLQKRLSELKAVSSRHELSAIEFDLMSQLYATLSSSIDDYTVEEKRAAIRTFIKKIVWDGENVHLYFFHHDGDCDFPAPTDLNSVESDVPSGEDCE